MPEKRLLFSKQLVQQQAILQSPCFWTRGLYLNLRRKHDSDVQWGTQTTEPKQRELFLIVMRIADLHVRNGAYKVVMKSYKDHPYWCHSISSPPKQRKANGGSSQRLLRRSCEKCELGTAQVLDNIPIRALKLTVKTSPDLFADTFETSLKKEYSLPTEKSKSRCGFPNPISYLKIQIGYNRESYGEMHLQQTSEPDKRLLVHWMCKTHSMPPTGTKLKAH